MMQHDCLLDIQRLSVEFGGLKALTNINISINEGELAGLIGPNGAGKTTLFNTLTGLCKPSAGQIFFQGKDITYKSAHYISRHGIARTFQNIRLFKSLTVLDNLRIAYHQNMSYSVLAGIFRTKAYHRDEVLAEQKAMEMLELVGLAKHAQGLAVNLSYGNQRKLEIARAMVTQPKLLLLDEPAAGMNPLETQELLGLIKHLRTEFKLTILLIEHDMSLVMNLCEKLFVLDYGTLLAQGTVAEIKNNPQVIQAYLGADMHGTVTG